MLELFGFAWVTITFTCCVAAVSTRRSVLRWLMARADRKRLDDTVEIVRRPMRKVATYAALVVLAVPAGVYAGGGALPGPGGGFGGGTVGSAVVLTGDNSAGTGTLRIRPADEDTQLVLCDASNNPATEVCTAYSHYNTNTSTAGFNVGANIYLNTSTAYQRYNTSFGGGVVYGQSSSSAAGNQAGFVVFGTGGAQAGTVIIAATGASASTLTIGGSGTVSTVVNGPLSAVTYASSTNCSDGAGAAACSAAPAGSVVIDAGATTVVVSTTAVTANSQIFVQDDSSLGTKLGVTCNTAAFRDYRVSARTASTSFTITTSAAPVTNPACLSYYIIN